VIFSSVTLGATDITQDPLTNGTEIHSLFPVPYPLELCDIFYPFQALLKVILIHCSGHVVGELPKYQGSLHIIVTLFRLRSRVPSPAMEEC
jgi:hypothetical protein